ncbi:hypothetical protein ACFV2X_15850 [Streptomyces sp. NPDC059679]|uniref:hypothetical protein n=1 Tax=Streptomyces sp. NPDC059679 TaxID=3346903 RepID=UPI003695F60F
MRIELRTPVPERLAAEIERRLFFVSPDITGYEVTAAGGEIAGLTLYSPAPLDWAALTEKVNYVVDSEVRPQLATRPKAIWTSPHRRQTRPGLFDRLVREGSVSETGEGQVAIGEPLLSLFAYFDRAIRDILAQDFQACAYRYPTLVKAEALATAGYFASFPQHLMFVTRLHNDIDVYRDFLERYGGGLDSAVLRSCANVDYCLPPTMCYHTFQQHSGRTLDGDRLHVVTSRGKSFRFEAGYATTLERLWDFTIREIVFMGARQQVIEARDRFMRKIFGFMEDLGLSGCCEVGNDPFFGGTDASEQIWSQRLLELKYELRLDVAPGRSIAVGSFNFHDDLFGRRFRIDHGTDGPVRSGCVGFGLERLVYAFLCQFDTDTAEWPATVREGVRSVDGG